MSYVIGVGLLIDGKPFNVLRQISMQLADETGNYNGLGQPPHVTIKRPFSVPDKATIYQVIAAIQKLAKNYATIEIELEGIENFAEDVIYASVKRNASLSNIHADTLERLSPYFKEIDAFEGPNVIFHSTIAMNLKQSQFKAAAAKLTTQQPTLPKAFKSVELGVFLAINDMRDWVVIHRSKLSGNDS